MSFFSVFSQIPHIFPLTYLYFVYYPGCYPAVIFFILSIMPDAIRL